MFGHHLEVVEDLAAEVSGQNVSLHSHLCVVLGPKSLYKGDVLRPLLGCVA